jgi:hypothetical protein
LCNRSRRYPGSLALKGDSQGFKTINALVIGERGIGILVGQLHATDPETWVFLARPLRRCD